MTDFNPYVGPRSFQESDGGCFFGREREALELLALVISERLVLFYAQSGAGKTSLINARLRPALRDKEGFEVLEIGRVSGALPEGIEPSAVENIYIFNLIARINDSLSDDEKLSPDVLSRTSLVTFLGADEVTSTDATRTTTYDTAPTVLIIDQFEEILTNHPDQWEKRADFFQQLALAQKVFPGLWVVLAMREDYVGALDLYAHLLPNRLRARFYMQRMAYGAALDAIQRPAERSGRPFVAGVAERLVDNLRQIRSDTDTEPKPGQFVEPVQMQVVCHQLWSHLPPSKEITAQDLENAGGVDTALTQFYEDALTRVSEQTSVVQPALRNWFSKELITEAGTRGTVYQGQERTGSLYNEAVIHLESQHLIRAENRAGGRWYELVHDRLVQPIIDANARWLRRNPLVRKAQDWKADGEPQRLLLSEHELVDALRDPEHKKLGRVVTKFLKASEERTESILRLQKVGWGVIFTHDADPAVQEALDPLLALRREQAQDGFRVFTYRPGEKVGRFLIRYEVAPASPRFERIPYYLLIVGGPDVIPWEFQYQLAVDYAVGRVHFDFPDDYANYAQSVVAVEEGGVRLPRKATFFTVVNPDDRSTGMAREHLTLPLLADLRDENAHWSIDDVSDEDAMKTRLARLLGGPETPAFLFTSCHSMGFGKDDPRQFTHQGALLCRDWPGPKAWRGSIPEDFYFAGHDVSKEANLLGLVAFFTDDYTAGMPHIADFSHEPSPLTSQAFVGRLPKRLLSHPRGGALAVIGHVERMRGFRFLRQESGESSEHFVHAVSRLLSGYPVGAAMEPFNQRYVRLATYLSAMLDESRLGAERQSVEDLRRFWTVVKDTRNWVIIGDPAVRLAVSDEEIASLERPSLDPISLPYHEDGVALESYPLEVHSTDSQDTAEKLYFNGVNGGTGDYDLPPMTLKELFTLITTEGRNGD